MFKKRLGGNEQSRCEYGHRCPQILEQLDGDFVFVGMDVTEEAIPAMLPGPGIGPKERAVRLPRNVVVAARTELPVA